MPPTVRTPTSVGFSSAPRRRLMPSSAEPYTWKRLPGSEYAGVGRRSEGLHVVDGCLQRIFQWSDVPRDLGEVRAALEGSKEQIGQPRGICLSADAAELLHALDSS